MTKELSPKPITIGLTGVMGSGKSTVASEFSKLGAVIFDADKIIRQLQQPGRPGYTAMEEILGATIIKAGGELDRKRIAAIIFADKHKRHAVEAALHPLMWKQIDSGLRDLGAKDVAILDIPILGKEHLGRLRGVVVVDASAKTSVKRLERRDFSKVEAEARISQQLSREERLAMADFVINNDGTREELIPQVSRAWEWAINLNHHQNVIPKNQT